MAIDVKAISKIISQEPLEIVGRLVDASNASLLCKVNDEIQVIYKPIAGERPLWDFPDGNLASREVATFYLSEVGEFGIVPPTVLRDGPYGPGAVQYWVEIDETIDVVEIGQKDLPRLRSLALFDAVINNTDRKFGHILVRSVDEIYGCDHGVSLHSEDKLRTVLWQWSNELLVDSEKEQLKNLKSNIDRKYLSSLLTDAEISALDNRIDRLLDTGRFPIPSEEWPAVPWPPY